MAATREFDHPEDKVDRHTSPDTIRRFREDRRRFPVPAYRRYNVLWSGKHYWRFRSPEESEQIHGLPRGYTALLGDTATRNSAIGNMMRLYSIQVLLRIVCYHGAPQVM